MYLIGEEETRCVNVDWRLEPRVTYLLQTLYLASVIACEIDRHHQDFTRSTFANISLCLVLWILNRCFVLTVGHQNIKIPVWSFCVFLTTKAHKQSIYYLVYFKNYYVARNKTKNIFKISDQALFYFTNK